MADMEKLQSNVLDKPYSIEARLALAREYAAVGYPDLSAGEAYMALLLIDEVRDDGGEYHDEAFEAAQEDFRSELEVQFEAVDEQQQVVHWAQGRVECET